MTPKPPLALALAAALAAGCLGLPPGAAGPGDSVTVLYSAYDLADGALLRENRTVSFSVGDGGSGLGEAFEDAVRGHGANDTFEVTVRDDPSLDYSERAEANRTLSPIPVEQSAPREDFERYVGAAAEGQTFDAYGIYTGQVTNVTNETVSFRIIAQEGQEDAVPSVGATLVTTITGTHLLRRLDPVVGATFTIQPPSPFQPTTPLGLQAGSYKVQGATEDKLVFLRSASGQGELVGRDLRIVVTVLEVTDTQAPVPTSGNFGVRDSPQVNGDPSSVLAEGGQPLASGSAGEGHEGH